MQFYSSSFSDLSFNYCCLTCLPSSSFMILSRSSFFSSSSVNSVNSTSFPTLSFEKVIQIVNPISERCSAFFVEKILLFFLIYFTLLFGLIDEILQFFNSVFETRNDISLIRSVRGHIKHRYIKYNSIIVQLRFHPLDIRNELLNLCVKLFIFDS